MVSVIIPVYNKEKFINRSISSVLKQSYPHFELLLINDASTDNSFDEINKFDDERLKIFHRNKPGSGGYAARNLGIEKSKAEWITFLDADDEWMPDHLEQLVTLIKAHPQIDIFSAARLQIQGGDQSLDSFSSSQVNNVQVFSFLDYLKNAVKERRAIGMNTVAIRKSKYGTSNWFPDGRTDRTGDLYTWVKLLAESGKFCWSPHIGSKNYRDVVGVSRKNVPNLNLFIDMVDELKKNLDNEEVSYLKKYSNRLIRRGWFEYKYKNLDTPPLFKYLFWEVDFWFCLKWQFLSYMPSKLLTKLRSL